MSLEASLVICVWLPIQCHVPAGRLADLRGVQLSPSSQTSPERDLGDAHSRYMLDLGDLYFEKPFFIPTRYAVTHSESMYLL